MRHHAIVVSASYGDHIDRAHSKAVQLGMVVSDVVASPVNSVRTFLVAPDGSKDGWKENDKGDANRAEFVAWLDKQRYSDGSGPLSWVEVQYGDDDRETCIIRHSDEESRCIAGDLD